MHVIRTIGAMGVLAVGFAVAGTIALATLCLVGACACGCRLHPRYRD